MIPVRHVLLVAGLIWLAAIGQGRAAHALSIRGAQPDFPLVVLACGSLTLGGARGALLGFWAGLLTAALLPMTYGSVFVSRIAAGAVAGGLGRSLIRDNLVVAPLVVVASTLLTEGLGALIAPGSAVHDVRHWLRLLGGEMVYNAILAVPISLLLRLFRVGQVTADPFGRLS